MSIAETEFEKDLDVPEPGIYADVPFEQYLSWKAVSNSRLSRARRSLLHFKEEANYDSPALRIGRFIHCGVLEPLAIQMRYAVMPPFELDKDNCTAAGAPSTSTGTTYYKNKVREFKAANQGKEVVEQSEYDMLLGISKSLNRSTRAREYLADPGETELSIVWVDPETGLLCKARIDFLNSGINDLKSCADAMNFSKSIANYGYHRQGAFYRAGYQVLTGKLLPFRLIAVEKDKPYGVRAAPLNEDAIEVGESEVRETLRAIKGAYDSGTWPCYDDPSSWCLPSYYQSCNEPIELTIDGKTINI